MSMLIKAGAVIEDGWRGRSDDGPVIVSLEHWQAERERLLSSPLQLGLCLPGDLEIGTQLPGLLPDLAQWGLIAIDFPAFVDGRGFSLATQLRQYGFSGELRACGYILVDQLHYLQRCGFDAFELADDIDVESALAALKIFSASYQPSWDQRGSLFDRKRSATR